MHGQCLGERQSKKALPCPLPLNLLLGGREVRILSGHASPLQVGCAIIAGFLHYLFLACFFWMLIEAVMLFLMVRNLKVVNYFSSRNIKMLYLCAFAYGVPGLVVLISASVQPQGYGTHNL